MTSATIGKWQFYLGSAASPQVYTSLTEVFEVSGVGATSSLVDVTNFDSTANTREYIAGLADGAEFTVSCNYVAGSSSQEMAMTAAEARATRLARLTYTGSSPNERFNMTVVCLGYTVGPSPTERNTLTFQYKINTITRS